jgi:hypothetical protein
MNWQKNTHKLGQKPLYYKILDAACSFQSFLFSKLSFFKKRQGIALSHMHQVKESRSLKVLNLFQCATFLIKFLVTTQRILIYKRKVETHQSASLLD